jgi:glycosyltransferase involved in cell wall biosynthesis
VLRVEPDNRIFERCPVRPRGYILAQSSTQPHKNIGVLLQAFAASDLAGVDLVLFGSTRGADFEAAGHTVPSSVRFTGQVSDAELVALMKGAAAFACPSTTEGFGLPPLEAMALGCPVIVAPCGALPEVCGDAALVAGPDDASAWRARILEIVDDAALADDLRRRGLARAENFTWAKAARRLLEILDRC